MIEFLSANWLWIVLIGAMGAMHRGRGCGGHGRGHDHGSHGSRTGADRSAGAARDGHAGHR